MHELEPSWERVIAIAWLIMWRGFVGAAVLGFFSGLIIGFIGAVIGSRSAA